MNGSTSSPFATTIATSSVVNSREIDSRSAPSGRPRSHAISAAPRIWIRNGWMKFMWPTWPIVGFSAASPVSTRLPPWRPATHVKPSRASLSAKNFSTLTCRIMLPGPVTRGLRTGPLRGCRFVGAPHRARDAPCGPWLRPARSCVWPNAGTLRAAPARRGRSRAASRNRFSENICASSESSCRCCSVACSGTRSTNTARRACRPARRRRSASSGARTRRCASRRPLMRPCGIAIPWPSPVEPSFSRAWRLSTT